jgi:hypothetical protein
MGTSVAINFKLSNRPCSSLDDLKGFAAPYGPRVYPLDELAVAAWGLVKSARLASCAAFVVQSTRTLQPFSEVCEAALLAVLDVQRRAGQVLLAFVDEITFAHKEDLGDALVDVGWDE